MDRARLAGRYSAGAAAISALMLAAGSAGAAEPSIVPGMALDTAALVQSPVPARWSVAAAGQLVDAIQGASAEGLNPGDYRLGELKRAVAAGAGSSLDAVADMAALALAHDYYLGRVDDRGAMGWMIRRAPEEQGQLRAALWQAVAAGEVTRFYASLLPADARYRALRDGLARASDQATRDRLRANLERARWMPRATARDYLYVNVPSYRLQVVNGGEAVSTYTVVVGAKDTPTPEMISPATSLVVNPWWNVPVSIVRKSNMRPGRAGFQASALGGGSYAFRQPPGPRNALGRIKFNLVNDQAIYLHDTPAKAGFARDERALSHGCVRVKDIDRLATELMENGGDAARLDEALATTQTQTLRLPQTWPVYIVYFTADVDAAGSLVAYSDPYGYDQRIVSALGGRPVEIASR